MTIICSAPHPTPSTIWSWRNFRVLATATLFYRNSFEWKIVCEVVSRMHFVGVCEMPTLHCSAIFQLISSCKYFIFFSLVVFAYVYTIRWVIRERQVHRKRVRLMGCFDCDCNGWLIVTALDKKLARWNMPESVFLIFWCRYVDKHLVLVSVWR